MSQFLRVIVYTMVLLALLASHAEASHYRGGSISYKNLGKLGGTSAEKEWFVIEATVIIYQRRSAHCDLPSDGLGTCCAKSCVGRQLHAGGTFTWGAAAVQPSKPHPTLSPAGQLEQFSADPWEVIDEDVGQDAVLLKIVLYRIYSPSTVTTTITWGSCCWIGTAKPGGNGFFELKAVVQVNSGNQSPTFNSPLIINACKGRPLSHNLNPSDPDQDGVEVILTAAAGGADQQVPPLTVNKAGVLNWSSPEAGLWNVTVVAHDLLPTGARKGASSSRDFLLNVVANCSNSLPQITLTAATASVAPGQKACTKVTVADPDSLDKLTIRISPTKAGVTLTPPTALTPNQTNPYTFEYCWTPTGADESSVSSILFTLTDNGTPVLSAQKVFVVTVTAGKQPTITVDPTGLEKSVDEDKCTKFTATGADADGPIKELSVTKPAFCTATTQSLGVIEVECCPGFDDSDHSLGTKEYKIEFSVTDQDATPKTASATVTLTVNDVNRVPELTNPGPQEIDEKLPLQLQIAATDPDGDDLSWSLAGLPQAATISDSGQINWTPTAADIGKHTAKVTVKDAGGAETGIEFEITVKDVNDTPTITSTPPTAAYVGEELSYGGTVTDPDSADSHTWTLNTSPGSIGDQSGVLTWTPVADDLGKEVSFEIQVCDNGTPTLCVKQSFKVKVDRKCALDTECPGDEICIVGPQGPMICVDPGCAILTPKCSDSGDFCKDGSCSVSLCESVTCDADEYCNPLVGGCIKACADVVCDAGKKCILGACVDDPCATAGTNGGPCADDEVCDDSNKQNPTCVKTPCTASSCRHGRVCSGTVCVAQPCGEITCPNPATQRCVVGECVERDDCNVDIDCSGDEVCLENGKCHPAGCYADSPNCADPKQQCLKTTCGKNDCGDGTLTCQSDELCRPTDNSCIKLCLNANCDPGQICQDGACVADPCANVTCDAGQVCITGTCETDHCVASSVCRHGRICLKSKNRCGDDPCSGLTCPPNSECREGQCYAPPQCTVDTDCPSDLLCIDGKCLKPGCSKDSDCTDGQLCHRGACVDDPCKDTTCSANQFCRAGKCIDSCAGVFCPDQQICVDGACTSDSCANVSCQNAQICIDGKCVEDTCASLSSPCKAGRVCRVDQCLPDNCAHINCPAGQSCQQGQCTGDRICTENSDCPTGAICDNGICAPEPDVPVNPDPTPDTSTPDTSSPVDTGSDVNNSLSGGGGCNHGNYPMAPAGALLVLLGLLLLLRRRLSAFGRRHRSV